MKSIRLILFIAFFLEVRLIPAQEKNDTYICNYSDNSFVTILSSGPLDGPLTDIYGIGISDLERFQREGNGTSIPESMPVAEYVNKALNYLNSFDLFETLEFDSFSIEVLSADDSCNPEHIPFYFIYVSFRYDNKNQFQIVPMLIDGRIILSIHES